MKRIPACKFLNGTSNNIVMDLFIKITGETAGNLFHACPYYGEIKITNMTANSGQFFSLYSEGYYRTFLKFYDDVDDNLFTLNLYSDVKSDLKVF